jgi:L,D-peptidoglycan transpeptidase YkuD (ErfK/YbiS/YcfS/YnhG family)
VVPCALGRGGIRAIKREGDGATPLGRWRFLGVLWRPDRLQVPRPSLNKRQMKQDMGWCDAPLDRNYNRPVKLPYPASHEEMWRSDHLYDIVAILSHNVRPRRAFGGSAVFLHLASEDLKPTAGCIAILRRDASRVLDRIGRDTVIVIEPGTVRPCRRGDLRKCA